MVPLDGKTDTSQKKRQKRQPPPMPIALPRLGLGTFKLKGDACVRSVQAALQTPSLGLVDCAHIYANEREVGRALARSGLREDVFVQTKLWRSHQGVDATTGRSRAAQALPRQLKLLGLTHVDCWLLHWPGPGRYLGRPPVRKVKNTASDGDGGDGGDGGSGSSSSGSEARLQELPWRRVLIERNLGADAMVPSDWNAAMRHETWRVMCADLAAGRAKALGACNLSARQLRELLAYCDAQGLARPALLQNELHPLLRQPATRALCRAEGILFQASAPLGAGVLPLAELPPVMAAAAAHGASAAQVLLAWCLARADSVLVKFSSAVHAAENKVALQLELSAAELAAIDACGDEAAADARTTMGTWLKERDPDAY